MHEVVFSYRAQANLTSIFRYIARKSSAAIAERYVEAIRAECRTLAHLPERGTQLGAYYPGLRTTGFRRSATIAFRVSGATVTIIAIFYRGRNVSQRLGGSTAQA